METEMLYQHYMKCVDCNNDFENCDPCILPCLHSLCPTCFDKIKDKESSICPNCFEELDWRQTVTEHLPKDHHRKDVLEYYKIKQDKHESLVCKTCGERVACAKCTECVTILCQICLKKHEKFLKSHNVTSFEKIKSKSFNEMISPLICSEHQLPMQRYCHSDQQPICSLCEAQFQRSNEGHLVEDVITVYASKRKELELTELECKQTFGTVADLRANIENEILSLEVFKQKHTEAIDGSINNFIAVLEKRREELKRDLQTAIERNDQNLNKKFKLLKDLERKFNEALEFFSLSIEYLGQEDFCGVESLIADRFHGLAEQSISLCSEEEKGKIVFARGDVTMLTQGILSNKWLSLVEYKLFVYEKVTRKPEDEKELSVGYLIISFSNGRDDSSPRCPIQAVVTGKDGKELRCNLPFSESNKRFDITTTLKTQGIYTLVASLNNKCLEKRQFTFVHPKEEARQITGEKQSYGTKERLDDLEPSEFSEQEMQCPICNKDFLITDESCPRILPCLHVMDSDCILKEIKDGYIKCPICEDEHPVKDDDITCFTRDETRRNLSLYWKIRSEDNFIHCSEHYGDRAEFWCQKCSEFICQRCMINHSGQKHQPIISLPTLDTLKTFTIRELHVYHSCKEYGHEDRLLELFCLTCDKVICHECHFSSHQLPNHVVEKISGVYRKRFAEIEALMEKVSTSQEKTEFNSLEVIKELEKLEDSKKRETNAIRKNFNNCKTIIDKRWKALEAEMKSIVLSKEQNLQDQLNELEKTVKLTSISFGRALDLVHFSSDVSFLNLYPTLRKRLVSLIDSNKKYHAPEHGWLKFIDDKLENKIANITIQSGKISSPSICLPNTKYWTTPLLVQQDDVCLKLQFLDKDGNVVSPSDFEDFIRMEIVDSKGHNLDPTIGTIICGDENMSVRIKFADVGEYILKLYVCHTSLVAGGFKISVQERTEPTPEENNKKTDGLNAEEGTSVTTTVSQKHLQVVPSKPESLEASETKEGGLILSWIPPKNDGGSEIRYYNIYQLINDSQQQIGRVSSGINAYKVTNLSAGIKYRFEVLAGNSVGCGEPSVTTKTISGVLSRISPIMKEEERKSLSSDVASTCKNPLLVGAIDFGSTFSGWAYSFVHEFNSNPTKVNTKQWTSGRIVTEKTPTCALISPDGRKLIAFGYDAEKKYRELAEMNKHRNYYYFRRFKMKLNKEVISRDLLIEDEMGKAFLAIDVFSYSIAALVDDMINTCSSRVSFAISKDDVLWVLTVPAIWSDAAKQFMREAARNEPACIKSDKLLIALEPEAAALDCRYQPVESFKDKYTITTLQIGTKYMVLDAGGGTIDITVHEVDSSGGLKEVYAATGGERGGILVDEAFRHLLTHLMGNEVYETFVSTETEDYLELWQLFEIKKKTIDPDNSNKITLTICDSLRKLSEKMRGVELKDAIARSRYGSQIEVHGDKIRIDSIVMQELFQKAISTTVALVKSILRHNNCRDVEAILMVGEFSESPMLQKAIKQEFSNLKIINPKGASTSILRGAVIFGHDPLSISQRVLGKTYGTETTKRFE